MRRFVVFALVALIFVTQAQAHGHGRHRRSDRCWSEQPQSAPVVQSAEIPIPSVEIPIGNAAGSEDALAEVNAVRARRGLRAFVHDALLTQAACSCAKQRAARLIAGHLPESDFHYLPVGANANAAGCAAWTPDWGWGACCTYDNYAYAGAAWTMGSDGRRYMHLFVR